MQKGLQKLIAIVLLGCLLMTTVGYHLVFRVQLHHLKAEMKRNLRNARNRKELTELSFDADQLQQLAWEDEQEFNWKGEWYDVVEKKMVNGRLHVLCIADKKEKKLLENYQENTDKHHKGGLASLVKLIMTSFICTAVDVLYRPQKELTLVFEQFSSRTLFRPTTLFKEPPEVC